MIGTSDHKQYDNEMAYLIGNHTEIEPPTKSSEDQTRDFNYIKGSHELTKRLLNEHDPMVDTFKQRWNPIDPINQQLEEDQGKPIIPGTPVPDSTGKGFLGPGGIRWNVAM